MTTTWIFPACRHPAWESIKKEIVRSGKECETIDFDAEELEISEDVQFLWGFDDCGNSAVLFGYAKNLQVIEELKGFNWYWWNGRSLSHCNNPIERMARFMGDGDTYQVIRCYYDRSLEKIVHETKWELHPCDTLAVRSAQRDHFVIRLLNNYELVWERDLHDNT